MRSPFQIGIAVLAFLLASCSIRQGTDIRIQLVDLAESRQILDEFVSEGDDGRYRISVHQSSRFKGIAQQHDVGRYESFSAVFPESYVFELTPVGSQGHEYNLSYDFTYVKALVPQLELDTGEALYRPDHASEEGDIAVRISPKIELPIGSEQRFKIILRRGA